MLAAVLILPAIITANNILAADLEAGEDKAVLCASCHGAEGISDYHLWPNLAGQNRKYLELQLRAYRNGGRYDPWMSPIAALLTDEDIRNLAAYFSKL